MQCNALQDYALPFAAWEMRLYLDSHPWDQQALAAYRQICAQSRGELNYACLPDSGCGANRWTWIDDPWPWEPEANPAAREV